MKRNVGTILFTVVAGTILTFAATSNAGDIRLQRADSRGTRADRTMREPAPSSEGTQIIRMQGTLQYDRQRGLRLDGVPVLIDRRTALPSASLDQLPSGRDLDGTVVMLYGVRTTRGVRATLILSRDESFSERTKQMITPDRAVIQPSGNDERTGVYLERSPS
jgi:hypothetical protein